MKQRLKLLESKEIINLEDSKVLEMICIKLGEEELSLLDLTSLKGRLESYLRSTTDSGLITLYRGLINIVEEYTKEFTQKKEWRIM